MLTYAFDLDGTITMCSGFGASRRAVPWWIMWLVLFFYKPKINKSVSNSIKALQSNGTEVIIITRRPPELEKITRDFLLSGGIEINAIYFVGNRKNSLDKKIETIIAISPYMYIDNNKIVVKKLKERGFNAVAI